MSSSPHTIQLIAGDHVLADSDWKIDLHIHVADALEALMEYLGVKFEEGRLHEIACEAAVTATNLILDDVRAGKTREVSPACDRPLFCFWTAVND